MKNDLLILAVLAGAAWYFWGKKPASDLGRQEPTYLPNVTGMGTVVGRTVPYGPEEISAIRDGRASVSREGWLKYAEMN